MLAVFIAKTYTPRSGHDWALTLAQPIWSLTLMMGSILI